MIRQEPAVTEPSTRDMTRIMLRPLASSLPLGFFAFGTGTTLLTAVELSWIPLAQQALLLQLALIVVVPLELLAGILAFLARDGGAATALAFLAAVWAGIAAISLQGPPGARSPVLALFLLTIAPMMLGFGAAALRGKPAFAVLILLGFARFTVTGLYQAIGGHGLELTAGWLGVPLAVVAMYGGFALLLEDTSGRAVLPIGRTGAARLPGGALGEHLDRTTEEAGVRSQL